jgi:hypothetical protein
MEEKTVPVWDTMKKHFCFVGYNRRKFVMKHPEIVLWYIPHRRKPLPLYPTPEKNLFRCIPQRRKTSSIVSKKT